MEFRKSLFLVINLLTISQLVTSSTVSTKVVEQPCSSQIYCYGKLLHTVQMAEPRIAKDSKAFVDRPLKYPPTQVLLNFDLFMKQHEDNPPTADIIRFVDDNFEKNSTEFDVWEPDDWHRGPQFLQKIKDLDLRQWADELHEFWFELGRNITAHVHDHPELYSMVYVPNPVIVPGGRFKEFYYWDSYWIQEGLLLSEMYKTVRGMISNFVDMVEHLGFVPNGGRIYYQRSQPPFLIPMVKNYLDATGDTDFLNQIIGTLDKEFDFWIKQRMITVRHADRDYRMARYDSNKAAPRPESYREDYELAEHLATEEEKNEMYFNLHAGAESGWDFSSKWFMAPPGADLQDGLQYIKTRHIIPVELNALMYYNAELMSTFHAQKRNIRKSAYYKQVALEFWEAINDVLWDDNLGSWFDYDMLNNTLRKEFYPTNLVPLWAGAYKEDSVVIRVMDYMRKIGATSYASGIPSSLSHTGQQWDFPNGWAPSQSLVIQALEKSNVAEAKALAFDLAQRWVRTNYKSFYQSDPNHMFEKYDVTVDGLPGGGGEYDVVVGFGWTNGVVLDFMNTYGDRLTTGKQTQTGNNGATQIPVLTSVSVILISLCVLTGLVWG